MKVAAIQNYSYLTKPQKQENTVFGHGGKPITLDYVVKNRAKYLPERVLKEAKKILADLTIETPSLMDLHKRIYAPLLNCKTLDEAKALFPEFEDMTETVEYKRKSVYAKAFKKNAGDNFALTMLQEVWANAKSLEQIAQELGMYNRTTLAWPLKQINFIGLNPNYLTILRASDVEGNKTIAAKTTAWNQLHPDLMYAKNKRAAQGCKTEEYRQAQRDRMYEYDLNHPERAQKISEFSKEMWANAPQVKQAMTNFFADEPAEVRRIVSKKIQGYPLRAAEYRMIKGAYERFWELNPDMKAELKRARKEVAERRKKVK